MGEGIMLGYGVKYFGNL